MRRTQDEPGLTYSLRSDWILGQERPKIQAVRNGALDARVHLLTGMVFLAGVIKYKGYKGRILKIVGMAYVAVTIVGFLTSGFLPVKSRAKINDDAMAN